MKKYSKSNYFNYEEKGHKNIGCRGESEKKRQNFIKSINRARQKVFDIVASNVDRVPDYQGVMQKPKFLTLTFADNITDLETANEEFTKFNKRLSYKLYGVHKNVLKYICVPEFQKRGAVHYHAIYFNMPYMDFKELGKIWGKGYIFIEGVSKKDKIDDFAKYIAKYINKENSKGEDNFQLYEAKDMLNRKRYFASKGLHKPEEYKLSINNAHFLHLKAQLADHSEYNETFENDFVGSVEINGYIIEDQTIHEEIKSFVMEIYKTMSGIYNDTLSNSWNMVNAYKTIQGKAPTPKQKTTLKQAYATWLGGRGTRLSKTEQLRLGW